MSTIRIFVSYSRADERWVQAGPRGLVPWLAESLRREDVVFWVDPELRKHAGEDYREKIRHEIERAQFALLLVSQDFVNSPFIRTFELPLIRQRVERGQLAIIPVLVGPTLWEGEEELGWLTARQMLPGKPTPLIEYINDEAAWQRVRVEILAAIKHRIRNAVGQEGGVVAGPQSARRPQDEHDFGALESQLRTMYWDGRWNLGPLDRMEVRTGSDGITITNTTTEHNHARVVLDRVLPGDFTCEIELKGQYTDLQIADAGGEDRTIYTNPSAHGIAIREWHTYRVARRSDTVVFEHSERGALPSGNFQADTEMTALVCIALMMGETVTVRSWRCSE